MEFLTSLALLACPVGMGLMMWFMMRGMNGDHRKAPGSSSLEALRAERARIDAELAGHESADGVPTQRVA